MTGSSVARSPELVETALTGGATPLHLRRVMQIARQLTESLEEPTRRGGPTLAWSAEELTRPAPRVLVVDAKAAAEATLSLLSAHGLTGEALVDAAALEARLARGDVDLILLEVALEKDDGLGLCRRLSLRDGPPILVLSERAGLMDRVLALELGADDHLAKSAHPMELIARIRALLRRRAGKASTEPPAPAAPTEPRPAGDWSLDERRRVLRAPDGRTSRFTATEFRFVAAAFWRSGQVLSREQIELMVYGGQAPGVRTLNTLVSRVRRRMIRDFGEDLVTTIHGFGYAFEYPAA